jgi:hypothetical protein
MKFPPDQIEKRITSTDQAWEILNLKSSQFSGVYAIWLDWYQKISTGSKLQNVITDAVLICYARMTLRNGSLSSNPRSYHSEKHIDDLLNRLMLVSKHPTAQAIPSYGWSLLSLFMSSHDLHQSYQKNDQGLIGSNEQASFEEITRLIKAIDKKHIVRREHKELLKLMIHGSTFGDHQDNSGNVYQGNVVEYILQKVRYFDQVDKELAFLACDIDTANVAMDLSDYAQSSIDVYKEIQKITNNNISARLFFGKQQQQYFFEYQKFNSQLGMQVFAQGKAANAPIIKQVCEQINKLDGDTSNRDVVAYYQAQITALT